MKKRGWKNENFEFGKMCCGVPSGALRLLVYFYGGFKYLVVLSYFHSVNRIFLKFIYRK